MRLLKLLLFLKFYQQRINKSIITLGIEGRKDVEKLLMVMG